MKLGMTIEYLKGRADLKFKVDFRVNGAICTIVTKWDLICLEPNMRPARTLSII